MSSILEIRDGSPYWWMSPDIWVVPGADPNGPAGQPIAGEPAFLWARAGNRGAEAVRDARVNFYWSNPAAGVLRSNSTGIGSSFVDLERGETKEVLCVTPWVPQLVNDGHECLVAEVVHPSDPLPSPLPDEFDPPSYRQVAQRNITVLAMKKSMLAMTIQVAAPPRKERVLTIDTEIGGMLGKTCAVQLGLAGFQPADVHSFKGGLSLAAGCVDPGSDELKKQLKLSLKPGAKQAVYLKLWPPRLPPRSYLLLHVVARRQEKAEGGITYVVILKD